MRQATATDRYTMVNEGQMSKNEFVRQMRLEFPQFVTQWNGYDDSIQILKNKGMIFETGVNAYDQRQELNLSLDAIDRGTRYECEKANLDAETCDKAEFEKCKQTAITNLKKNPLHYIDLISGESNKVNKHDRETEVKRGEAATDTLNGMKNAELREDAAPRKTRMVKESTADGLRAIKAKYGTIPGFANIFTDFMNMHGEDIAAGADPEDEFEQFIIANSNVEEKYDREDGDGHIGTNTDDDFEREMQQQLAQREAKGKDLDGDGDIDGDDYKHAKDRAIKKAMGKDEVVKEAIKTVIKKVLSEAYTNGLQRFIDSDSDDEVQTAAKELMGVIEAIENDFLKHKDKIKAAYEKAGPMMAPALEKAFKGDLNSQRVSFETIELPKTPRLTPDQISQIDQQRGAGDLDEKETVFKPNNE